VQISEGKVSPSSWSLELEEKDLSRERQRLREASIAATEIGTGPGVISWFDLKDPDGNAMRWFQVLTTDSKVTGIKNKEEEGTGTRIVSCSVKTRRTSTSFFWNVSVSQSREDRREGG